MSVQGLIPGGQQTSRRRCNAAGHKSAAGIGPISALLGAPNARAVGIADDNAAHQARMARASVLGVHEICRPSKNRSVELIKTPAPSAKTPWKCQQTYP